MDHFPHRLVVLGQSQGFYEFLELDGGWGIGGASPIEESEGLGAGAGAGAEDAVDEVGGEGHVQLVESALHVEVAADDVGDVVDDGEVVIFLAA